MSPHDRQRTAAWRSGGGTQKLGRATNFSNSRKTFREHTPRMTPNRLLAAGFLAVLTILVHLTIIHIFQSNFFRKVWFLCQKVLKKY